MQAVQYDQNKLPYDRLPGILQGLAVHSCSTEVERNDRHSVQPATVQCELLNLASPWAAYCSRIEEATGMTQIAQVTQQAVKRLFPDCPLFCAMVSIDLAGLKRAVSPGAILVCDPAGA